MSAMATCLVVLCGLVSGALVGTVFGFSLASHADVLRGIRPNTTNRLILFLARPTRELSLVGGAVFVGVMCVWLIVLFGLCALPAIASQHLSGDGPPLILFAYGAFALASWLGRRFGAHAWGVIS